MKKIFFLILLLSQLVLSQNSVESLKRNALVHIQNERYGEAIDLLNKYISANGRNAEGYNLRGLCFEQREQYKNSVYDFRKAVKLEPQNNEYQSNLGRVSKIWYKILFDKIEGHKREIAIDPSDPFNYLEIGKCYRWMENWQKAEVWYDKYLARDDDASPDEIIRYSIILAKTGSIRKGEKILKKFTDRYPDDWRLLSRYGYFVMWLGKYNLAGKSFEKALEFKPYFKEALDGLDLAKKEGYLTQYQYSMDRVNRKEYPIDRYYRLTKRYPEKHKYRFSLMHELINKNRLQEASEQVSYFRDKYYEDMELQSKVDVYSDKIDSLKQMKIDENLAEYKNDSTSVENVIELADSYVASYYFDDGIKILKKYLDEHGEETPNEVRFKYAKYSAWNYDWEPALNQLDYLIESNPDNSEYKLLRGQISVWIVQDLDLAEEYLNFALEKDKNNIQALVGLVQLHGWRKEFEESNKYLELARNIDPNSKDLKVAENNLNLHISAAKEREIFQIRADAQQLAIDGDYEAALSKYDEYLENVEVPTKTEKLEYADINVALGNYETAQSIYDEILLEEDDPDVRNLRAKVFLWKKEYDNAIEDFKFVLANDSTNQTSRLLFANALANSDRYDEAEREIEYFESEFEDSTELNFIEEDPFKTKLFIADTYVAIEDYSDAEDIYEELLDSTETEENKELINKRLSWIPEYGFSKAFNSGMRFVLPNQIGINPYNIFYRDNQEFNYFVLGLSTDINMSQYWGIGGSFARHFLNSGYYIISLNEKILTEFKGRLNIYPHKYFTASFNYGNSTSEGEEKRELYGVNLSYKNKVLTQVSFNRSDARFVLYSPYLLHTYLESDVYRFHFSLLKSEKFYLTFDYKYIELSDNNKGNDLQFRVGKSYIENGYLGYEYFYNNYGREDELYYSPKDYESHSIWAKSLVYQKDKVDIDLWGKVGYAPKIDYIISEIKGELSYNPYENLIISGELRLGRSFRYDSKYDYISTYVSVYWSVY